MINIPNDTVNCFVPENLRNSQPGTPEGPLAGINFVAKDLFNVIGHRTSIGSPDFHRHSIPSQENAEAISKLLSAGANLVGMTICDEFFYSLTGANEHYGTPINCRAPGRLPGGSSSGSAAAVAAGLADVSLGSDTGGSVRIPASFCGLWGIRPTFGRVSLKGARAMAPSFDTVGWFANNVPMLSHLAQVLLKGKPQETEIKRIMIGKDAIARADAAVAKAITGWIEAHLTDSEEVTVSSEGLDPWWDVFRIIQAGEVKSTNLPWVRAHKVKLGPVIHERFLMAENISDFELNAAREHQKQIVKHLNQLIRPGSALVIPTAPCVAPLLNEDATTLASFRSNTMALTCIAGLGGLPQVSMPVLTVNGCPVGVSLIGTPGSDEQLIELAARIS